MSALHWLFTPSVTLSPMAVVGLAWLYSAIRARLLHLIRRQHTDIIDLPEGGRIEVSGYPDELLAEIVESTGGKLRARRWVR